jgi:hypothetical protein
MTTRAAINILGTTGELIDVTSLGVDTITVQHPGPGVYLINGTLGMVPPPLGWGYVLNSMDSEAKVDISFDGDILTARVSVNGEPTDLLHSITLHVAVEEAPPIPFDTPEQETPALTLEEAQAKYHALRAEADYQIAPLQGAVDIEEATPAEIALLKAWKKYRIELGRVSAQAGFPVSIDWPILPV